MFLTRATLRLVHCVRGSVASLCDRFTRILFTCRYIHGDQRSCDYASMVYDSTRTLLLRESVYVELLQYQHSVLHMQPFLLSLS